MIFTEKFFSYINAENSLTDSPKDQLESNFREHYLKSDGTLSLTDYLESVDDAISHVKEKNFGIKRNCINVLSKLTLYFEANVSLVKFDCDDVKLMYTAISLLPLFLQWFLAGAGFLEVVFFVTKSILRKNKCYFDESTNKIEDFVDLNLPDSYEKPISAFPQILLPEVHSKFWKNIASDDSKFMYKNIVHTSNSEDLRINIITVFFIYQTIFLSSHHLTTEIRRRYIDLFCFFLRVNAKEIVQIVKLQIISIFSHLISTNMSLQFVEKLLRYMFLLDQNVVLSRFNDARFEIPNHSWSIFTQRNNENVSSTVSIFDSTNFDYAVPFTFFSKVITEKILPQD